MTIQLRCRTLTSYRGAAQVVRNALDDAADRIDALEAENARLKGRVNELACLIELSWAASRVARDEGINTEPEA